MRALAFFAFVSLLALPTTARAIEIELSKNTQRMGFVDMQKIWKSYPETIRAKENYEELIRQAQEQINLRKVELIHLRNDLSQLKQEREYLAKTAPTITIGTTTAVLPAVVTPPTPVAPPSFSTQVVQPHTLAPVVPPAVPTTPLVTPPPAPATTPAMPPPSPTPRPDIFQLPGLAPPTPPSASTKTAVSPAAPPPGQPRTLQDLKNQPKPPVITNIPNISTAPAAPQPAEQPPHKPDQLVINIPGVSTAPVVVLPPAAVETPKSTATATAVQTSTGAASVAVANPALAELDAKISLKTRELDKKETDFKEYQAAQEKNLLDVENRKSEILLGKIDKAIKTVAEHDGVSMVQEKSAILMGTQAVDLTEEVIRYLQGVPLPQP